MFFNKLLPIITLFLIVVSCSSKNETENKKDSTIDNLPKTTIINIDQVKELIKRDDVLLIDNRPFFKYKTGYIKDAINLPFYKKGDKTNKMDKDNLIKAIGDKKIVIFYCTGRIRAKNGINQAKEWKIDKKLYWYKNGFQEWSKSEPFEIIK